MEHATYLEDDFPAYPLCERMRTMTYLSVGGNHLPKDFVIGIKTITHSYTGLKLRPHKTAVVEISQGDEVASFDLPASALKALGNRMLEWAALIEADKT